MSPDQEIRLRVLEESQNDVKDAIQSIRGSLESLVRLEERHMETRESLMRSFKVTDGLDHRVKAIEIEMPSLMQTRDWVVMTLVSVASITGLALISLVVIR